LNIYVSAFVAGMVTELFCTR